MPDTAARLSAKQLADCQNLVERVGRPVWPTRMRALRAGCTATYAGRALAQRHALELGLDRLQHAGVGATISEAEGRLLEIAGAFARCCAGLTQAGQVRLDVVLQNAMAGDGTLIALFHRLNVADQQARLGFSVEFAGLNDGARYDLLISCGDVSAEIICDVVSAEAGRDVHRTAWSQLVDRIDSDLQNWLEDHPGRYLLKMTLPAGLKPQADSASGDVLENLHRRITSLLSTQRRADHDEAAVLRLDPLMLAASQAGALGLLPKLRQEFGPEAHLAVTQSGKGVFVMAARAAREDAVAAAVHRRMAELAPTRFSGTRPGILAMFIEDTDRVEWRLLRDQLRLEGEARQFMTRPEARSVAAISCASRQELFGGAHQPAELRFRNPSHPEARNTVLAPAILSAV